MIEEFEFTGRQVKKSFHADGNGGWHYSTERCWAALEKGEHSGMSTSDRFFVEEETREKEYFKEQIVVIQEFGSRDRKS